MSGNLLKRHRVSGYLRYFALFEWFTQINGRSWDLIAGYLLFGGLHLGFH